MMNKVLLIGRLGKDVETFTDKQGDTVARFTLATTDYWKDANGDKQEKTEWHNVVAFKKLADICAKYFHKGNMVLVEGSVQTNKYQAEDGTDRYSTQIKAFTARNLTPKSGNDAVTTSTTPNADGNTFTTEKNPATANVPNYAEELDNGGF